jgi:hypothetical protein
MKIASPRFPVKMKISRQKSPYFPVKMKIKWSHLKKNYLKENSFLMGLTLLDWRPASPQAGGLIGHYTRAEPATGPSSFYNGHSSMREASAWIQGVEITTSFSKIIGPPKKGLKKV